MHIDLVSIDVPDASATGAFFADVLGLPTQIDAASATVTIGSSRLMFTSAGGPVEGYQHIAFEIPENAIEQSAKLAERTGHVLHDGADTILTSSGGWNASSVYFEAPGGLNLEFIARHNQSNRIDYLFTSADIIAISEVGIPVDNAVDAARNVATTFGLSPYGDPPAPDFTAMGSEEGLLILSRTGRAWRPTSTQITTPRHAQVMLSGVQGMWRPNPLAVVEGR